MTKKIFIILLLCFNWCGFYTIISQNKYSDYLFDKEDNLIINDSNIKIVPSRISLEDLNIAGEVIVKLHGSDIQNNGAFGIRIIPYINNSPCIFMFNDTDTISLIFTRPIKTLSFLIYIIKGHGRLYKYKTETISFSQREFLLLSKKMRIDVFIDE